MEANGGVAGVRRVGRCFSSHRGPPKGVKLANFMFLSKKNVTAKGVGNMF